MTVQPVRVVAGLGNPGPGYRSTRHNIGARLVSRAATGCNFLSEKRFFGRLARRDDGLMLLLPELWMNQNGRSISALMRFYKLPSQALLVVHDELDLPPGTARFKLGGGAGGHNGLRDTIAHLGDGDFARLRLGIGHPGQREKVTPWVLGTASTTEQELCERAMDQALQAMPLALQGDWEAAMNNLHGTAPEAPV